MAFSINLMILLRLDARVCAHEVLAAFDVSAAFLLFHGVCCLAQEPSCQVWSLIKGVYELVPNMRHAGDSYDLQPVLPGNVALVGIVTVALDDFR